MTLAIFKFESAQIRTFGTSETPLFVAIDVCSALGFGNHRQAIASHVDPEDLTKAVIETKGGKQTVNCVNAVFVKILQKNWLGVFLSLKNLSRGFAPTLRYPRIFF